MPVRLPKSQSRKFVIRVGRIENEVSLELTEKLRLRKRKCMVDDRFVRCVEGVGAWQVIPEDWCKMVNRAVCYFES